MAVVPFATPSQMEQRSRGAITATSHPFLAQELAAATREIQKYCGWHIAPALEVVKTRRGRECEAIWIPAMQISDVTITTSDDVEHVLGDDEFDPETGWTSWSGDRYTLTFTAGFLTVPEDLVSLTLQVAARALGSPLGAVREQTLVSSVLWSSTASGVAGGTVLLPHEKDALAEYRLGRLP